MESECMIYCLPDACLLAVFNFLQTSDLVKVSLTCRKLYNFYESARGVYKLLDFRYVGKKMAFIPFEGIWTNVTFIKFLSLRYCVRIRSFSPLKQMDRLERLDLYCTSVTDSDLIQTIPFMLTGIDLGYCDSLASSQVLRKFLLERCSLKMIGVAALEQIVNDEVSINSSECIVY